MACALMIVSCGEDDPSWQVVHEDLPGALLSIWGTSETDVWAVGGDALDGSGPLVLHWDGSDWSRKPTGLTQGDLWWVFGFADGPIYMGGSGGIILRYENDQFTQMDTPGQETVFGIWGASPDDVWAVGGASPSGGGFAWRLQNGEWAADSTLPSNVSDEAAVWKVFGTSVDDAWLVGSNGVSLHWNGQELSPGQTGVGASLFTVHAGGGQRYAAVGGLVTGIIVEYDGGEWTDVTPDPVPGDGLSGVCLGAGGEGIAVGAFGSVYLRDETGWRAEDLGFYLDQNLHATWIDPSGGLWAVGGNTISPPLSDGVAIYRGEAEVSQGQF